MPDRVEIRDRDGITTTRIPIRRDEHDDTKWHLDQVLAVGAHETAYVIVHDKIVEMIDDRSVPANTLFLVVR